ncbi:hypothetical protein QJS66_13295 [Kocuria rhizophila]|nr:hypothetical protein QJS66_13295 [Kocuria rhizophila]
MADLPNDNPLVARSSSVRPCHREVRGRGGRHRHGQQLTWVWVLPCGVRTPRARWPWLSAWRPARVDQQARRREPPHPVRRHQRSPASAWSSVSRDSSPWRPARSSPLIPRSA